MQAIIGALNSLNGLLELDISHNTLGERGCAALTRALVDNESLTALSLAATRIPRSHFSGLLAAIEMHHLIESLDLSDNRIDERLCAELRQLATCSNLTKLDLSWNGLSKGPGSHVLAQLLRSHRLPLASLSLSHNRLGQLRRPFVLQSVQCAHLASGPLRPPPTVGPCGACLMRTAHGAALRADTAMLRNVVESRIALESRFRRQLRWLCTGAGGAAVLGEALAANTTLNRSEVAHRALQSSSPFRWCKRARARTCAPRGRMSLTPAPAPTPALLRPAPPRPALSSFDGMRGALAFRPLAVAARRTCGAGRAGGRRGQPGPARPARRACACVWVVLPRVACRLQNRSVAQLHRRGRGSRPRVQPRLQLVPDKPRHLAQPNRVQSSSCVPQRLDLEEWAGTPLPTSAP